MQFHVEICIFSLKCDELSDVFVSILLLIELLPVNKMCRVGYVVLTSVDRDDMPDGGSDHFARTVKTLKVHALIFLREGWKILESQDAFCGSCRCSQNYGNSCTNAFCMNKLCIIAWCYGTYIFFDSSITMLEMKKPKCIEMLK